jgi:hypothetical protein
MHVSIAVTCPACTRTFRVKDKYAGKFGSCCFCSSAVRVPRLEIENEDSFDVLLEDIDKVNGSPGASLLNSVEIVRCPNCDRRNLGGVQTCAHCGSLLK